MYEEIKSILKVRGIAEIKASPRTDQALLEIAAALGKVVPGARNEMVQNLPARKKGEGPIGSFSYSVGFGEFPWHTDTAYWDIPARYLLLYSQYASPCATLYQDFRLIREAIPDFDYLMDRSVFLLNVPGKKRYLSPCFGNSNEKGYRLDFHIYRPVNDEARQLQFFVKGFLATNYCRQIWTGENIAIMDNWMFIHAREDAHSDQTRMLKRIYINELV